MAKFPKVEDVAVEAGVMPTLPVVTEAEEACGSEPWIYLLVRLELEAFG